MCRRTFSVPYDNWSKSASLVSPPVYPQGELLSVSFNRHTGNILVSFDDSTLNRACLDSILESLNRHYMIGRDEIRDKSCIAVFRRLEDCNFLSPQLVNDCTKGRMYA